MNFPDALFSDVWAFGAVPLLALVLFWCVRSAPWSRLFEGGQSHVWWASLVVLTLLWSLKAGVRPGLNLHLLGATALTLMFGRSLAILGLCAVLAAVTLNQSLSGSEAWQTYALNALLLAVFPVCLAEAWRRLVERLLPANFFIYVFVAAFLGAAIVILATGALTTLVMWLGDVYALSVLFEDYFPYFILLGFSEAWLNGAAITLMVVFVPHWVVSFDDRRYLLNK
jgi:uncharacterized membrane protein